MNGLSMDRIPIEILARKINSDYYKYRMSFKEVKKKYKDYTEDELKKVLKIYDLDKETLSENDLQAIPNGFAKEWNAICRSLNKKAWARK